MQLKAIIFDMDGVLLDSQPLYHEYDIKLLGQFGRVLGVDAIIPYSCLATRERMGLYKRDFGIDEPVERLVELSVSQLREVFTEGEIKPNEGILRLLSYSKSMGLRLGVASSTSRELIELVLSRLGVSGFFEKIVSGEDVKAGKPAPDVYLAAAEAVGFAPSRCAAVEDSLVGMRSAKAAGLTCIGYRNSYTSDYRNADYVVESFGDCVPLIDRLVRGKA